MWRYQQSTGIMTGPSGGCVGVGWAGQGIYKNKPDAQNVKGLGPLPQGQYTIGAPYDHPHLGPFVMGLTPSLQNKMFGRSLFRIHGAAKVNPELSSEGCIIMPRPVREIIWNSGDRDLEVVA